MGLLHVVLLHNAVVLTERSLLLPINMMVMLGFACCRASSNQLAKWLKVSRLQQQTPQEHTKNRCEQVLKQHSGHNADTPCLALL
jgi:hypothetical protein